MTVPGVARAVYAGRITDAYADAKHVARIIRDRIAQTSSTADRRV